MIAEATDRDLLQHKTPNYEPTCAQNNVLWPGCHSNFAPFNRFYHVEPMMRNSRVSISLWALKGTVMSLSRFYIDEGEDDENPSKVKKFLIKQISRFWQNSAVKALSAIEWGYHGSEVLYKLNQQGQMAFQDLKSWHQADVKPVTLGGKRVGVVVERYKGDDTMDRKYVGIPKSFWTVTGRECDPWFGRSRLISAYDPWMELTQHGGAKDSRQHYYYKYGFGGEVLYTPVGSIPMPDGTEKPALEIGRSILEKARNGSTIVFENVTDVNGNREWELAGRQQMSQGVDIRDYVDDLKGDISEGMGVPDEVIEAADTGSGYSGRRIPQNALRGMLSEVSNFLIQDLNDQILEPLVRRNFGEVPDYEIQTFGLVRDAEEGMQEAVTAPGQEIPESATANAALSVAV